MPGYKMPVEFKGSNFTLLVVYLYESNPEVIRQALEDKIVKAPDFLKSAPVVINISSIAIPVNWRLLQKAICTTGLRIVGVSGCKDAELKAEIEHSCLPLLIEGKEQTSYFALKSIGIPLLQKQNKTQFTKTCLINTPVRSGQRIYAPNCDLIVTSHVSSGAELIADGNIHIYGQMCGRALAGASGDRSMQIFCTNLTAELVSIAGVYYLSDEIPAECYGKAARLQLTKNTLLIQPLN